MIGLYEKINVVVEYATVMIQFSTMLDVHECRYAWKSGKYLRWNKWRVCTFQLCRIVAWNFYPFTLLDANWIQLKTCSCNMQTNFIDFVDRHLYSTFNHARHEACIKWKSQKNMKQKEIVSKKYIPHWKWWNCEIKWSKWEKIRNIKVYWLKWKNLLFMNNKWRI